MGGLLAMDIHKMKRIFILLVIFSLLSLSCGQKQRHDNFHKKEEKVKIYSEKEISDLCSLSKEKETAIDWTSVAVVIILVMAGVDWLVKGCCSLFGKYDKEKIKKN